MSVEKKPLVNSDQGDAQPKPEEKQEPVSFACARYGKDIVKRHGDIRNHNDPDCLPKGFCLHAAILTGRSLCKELDPYPEHEDAADELDVLKLDEFIGKKRHYDPEHHRRCCPE